MRRNRRKPEILWPNSSLPMADRKKRSSSSAKPWTSTRRTGLRSCIWERCRCGPGRRIRPRRLTGRLSLPDKQYKPVAAEFLFNSGKQDQDVAELEKLDAADPADVNLRTKLLEAYLALNPADDAVKVLSAALKKKCSGRSGADAARPQAQALRFATKILIYPAV
jgi:hypothetical protein